jgi:anaerobic ribonucleoside-triphosphate reductase activating protein
MRIKGETDKTIWCYTGFTYEEILSNDYLKQILPYIDVLVDGPYMEELRNTELPFRGSENQRIIDVQKYLKGEEDYEWHLE